MALGTKEQPDQEEKVRNPGQEHYEETFNAPLDHPENKNLDFDREANRTAFDDIASNSLRDLERKTADSTAPQAQTTNKQRTPIKQRVQGLFKGTKKKWAIGGVAALLGAGTLGAGILIPSGIAVNFKEVSTRWATKYQTLGSSYRKAGLESKRYFGNPGCTDTSRWRCVTNRGVTEGHIERLRQLGFQLEGVRTVNDAGTRFQFDAMSFDSFGETIRVTQSNYMDVALNNPAFIAKHNDRFSSRAFFLRGKVTLDKVFRRLGIDRNQGVPTDGTREERETALRQKILDYGGSVNLEANAPEKENESESDRESRETGVGAIDNAVSAAEREKSSFVENGTAPNNITTSILNNTSALEGVWEVGAGATAGAIKGAVLGPLAAADNACTFYQTVRISNIILQAYTLRPLIGIYMVLSVTIDKMKAGEATPEEVSMVGDILTRPSVEEETRGLTLSDSPGYQLITQGAVGNIGDLSRYATGFTVAYAIQSLLSTISGNTGALKSTCGGLQSAPGQVIMAIAGIASCVGTVGGSCLAGATIGLVAGGILAALTYYLIPTIASAVVGMFIPDPLTDPQGSYGVGTALASGAAMLGAQAGNANGFPILTEDEYTALNQKTLKQQQAIAAADAINDREAGILDPNNPMSATNKLAAAMAPYSSKFTSSVPEAIAAAGGVVQKGFASLAQSTYATSPLDEGSTPADYGGRFCGNPWQEETDDVVTAFCTELRGPDPSTIPPDSQIGYDNHPYSFELLAEWMQENDYIGPPPEDEFAGEPLQEAQGDFKKFIDECIDQTNFRDFDGDYVSESLDDRSDCVSDEEKFERFRVYIQYKAIMVADYEAGLGDLGEEAGAPSTPESDSRLVSGTDQELAQQIIDSEGVTGDERYMGQIRQVAEGDGSCPINPTILQFLATMAQDNTFYITSLNRKCTEVLTASGTASYHYRDGGGHAVDFGTINGASSTGGTDEDIAFLKEAFKLLPPDSGFGQVNCRATPIGVPANMREFNDTCNHVHIEVPVQ